MHITEVYYYDTHRHPIFYKHFSCYAFFAADFKIQLINKINSDSEQVFDDRSKLSNWTV